MNRRFIAAADGFRANVSQIVGIDFPRVRSPELTLTEKTDRAREIAANMPNPSGDPGGGVVPSFWLSLGCVRMPQAFRRLIAGSHCSIFRPTVSSVFLGLEKFPLLAANTAGLTMEFP